MCTTHLYSDIQYFCKFHQCIVTRPCTLPGYKANLVCGPALAWTWYMRPLTSSLFGFFLTSTTCCLMVVCKIAPHMCVEWPHEVSSFLSMNPLTVGRITLLVMSCSTGERQLEFGTFHCVLCRSSELFTCCWKVVHVAKKQTFSQRSSLIQFWTCLSQRVS